MRRSSSSSFVSSLIRLDSLRASGPVFHRLRDAARDPVHDFALFVQGAELIVVDRGASAGHRLSLGDRADLLALALQSLLALEMRPELPDERGAIFDLPVDDEQGGQEASAAVVRKVRHE